ncbi:tripartite tricarboxylate transporter substrate-binding protein [uncultured Pigmentiphaga sp.]|uniref:tripartite tricarboxylate transporter substrate-binding protein n=1 Tax=uncultured Pigmentiphaga sp. TaxID=340361 RepID=UPI00260289F2|nr:tripartite tricarboxylate transporter substrate-binding protein [uncultured Pigmentiphaga sp.]
MAHLSFSSWNGIVAPSGTPKSVIAVLNRAVNQTISDPAVRSDLEKQGYEVEALDADQFQGFVREEFEKIRAIVKRLDATVRD